MATEVILPRQGQSVESCLILSWRKKPGDLVKLGEVICEVETDKATFEVEAPADGTMLATLFQEGDDVPVLSTIAYIGAKGEAIPGGAMPGSSTGTADGDFVLKTESPSLQAAQPVSSAVSAAEGQHISPRARNLARAKGVNTANLAGTGPGGRIVERDVQAALGTREPLTPAAIERHLAAGGAGAVPAVGSGPGGRITTADLAHGAGSGAGAAPAGGSAQAAAVAAAAPSTSTEPTVRPVRGVRKLIGERMLASLRDTAQLTMSAGADARAVLGYRKRLKGLPSTDPLSAITINDLVMFAVSRVLLNHPGMNATMSPDAITEYPDVNLGFAVDTPRGLLVPVVRNADRLTLLQLSAEAKRLGQASLAGNVAPDELVGATFTVTNLGNLGIESFTPVLNAPQVGILGVCAIVPRPAMKGDDVEFVPTIGLSLTIDHRAVDGAPGARFLKDVSDAIRDIELTLAR
ncbi:MAG TPA: dihydrolipoamide acetyltransferase family protein [Spirochaetia bacterium]|nr:dihydrolipoamide acetyltransferase family protein [Spirochaetia bacterium]